MSLRTAAPLLLLASCAGATTHARGMVPSDTPDDVNIALARSHDTAAQVAWRPWSRAAFDDARRQGRYVLLDGAAEWCHWCHVMDATTYRDPAVVRLINARFVAVRVDVDSRPDLAARYAEYGWPATIILGPDGEEVVKMRGYLQPQRLRAVLADIDRLAAAARAHPEPDDTDAETGEPALAVSDLDAAATRATRALDGFYDPAQSGWGTWQKLALGADVEFELRRAAHGDHAARDRARETVAHERALIDPVWGGVYQYSAGATWNDPHFEKLMPYQASNIEADARASVVLADGAALEDARHIEGYLARFLTNADGAFLPSQDADVNAHDAHAAFIDGHVYYARDDAGRRALGMPRIDPHVYARENGLAIAALCALYDVAHDDAVRARAVRAADLVLRTLVTDDGAVRRAASDDATSVRYLADAAAFGRALARLAEVTHDARYRERAVAIARAMLRDFADGAGAMLFAQTTDPAATTGALSRRLHTVRDNALAVRFLAELSRATGDDAHRARAVELLRATATPRRVASVGRFVGEILLAFDDAGAYPWPDRAAVVSPSAVFTGEHSSLHVQLAPPASVPGDAVLTVELHGTGDFHVNDRFPVVLELAADRAEVRARLVRADATTLGADGAVFRVPVRVTGTAPVVRGVFRFAVCGATECQPEEQRFTVGLP